MLPNPRSILGKVLGLFSNIFFFCVLFFRKFPSVFLIFKCIAASIGSLGVLCQTIMTSMFRCYTFQIFFKGN